MSALHVVSAQDMLQRSTARVGWKGLGGIPLISSGLLPEVEESNSLSSLPCGPCLQHTALAVSISYWLCRASQTEKRLHRSGLRPTSILDVDMDTDYSTPLGLPKRG